METEEIRTKIRDFCKKNGITGYMAFRNAIFDINPKYLEHADEYRNIVMNEIRALREEEDRAERAYHKSPEYRIECACSDFDACVQTYDGLVEYFENFDSNSDLDDYYDDIGDDDNVATRYRDMLDFIHDEKNRAFIDDCLAKGAGWRKQGWAEWCDDCGIPCDSDGEPLGWD